MKKIQWCVPVLVIFATSCSKTSKSGNSNTPAFYLSSATTYTVGNRYVDSFSYDSSHYMTEFIQSHYDTTGGIATLSTITAAFTSSGTSAPPASYTYTAANTSQTHSLSYDGTGRITKDTCSATGYVAYFTYPSGNIAINVLLNGSASHSQSDTIFVSNGNVSAVRNWVSNSAGTGDSLIGSLQFAFSTTANPLYHAALTAAVGPLFYVLQVNGFGTSLDPISVNALSSITGSLDGYSGVTLNYSLINDAVGRLNVMSASLLGDTQIIYFEYY